MLLQAHGRASTNSMHLTDHINFAAYCDRTVNLPTTGPKRDPLARRLKPRPVDLVLTHFLLAGHSTPNLPKRFRKSGCSPMLSHLLISIGNLDQRWFTPCPTKE